MGYAERFKRSVTGLPRGPQVPRLRDSLGRVLELGDEVLVTSPHTLMRVAEIKPVFHPGVPPGTVALVLVTRSQLMAPSDSAIEGLFRTRHQAEIGDGLVPSPPAEETESPDGEPATGDESGPADKPTVIITD